jgi:hypothetical protein
MFIRFNNSYDNKMNNLTIGEKQTIYKEVALLPLSDLSK